MHQDKEVQLTGPVWTDEITTTKATVVASYQSGQRAHGAAVTLNEFGSGSAWYLSSEFHLARLSDVLSGALSEAGIVVDQMDDENVETVVRNNDTESITAYINQGDETVRFDDDGIDAVSGVQNDAIMISPISVQLVRRSV